MESRPRQHQLKVS